jgi:hypothetical protein
MLTELRRYLNFAPENDGYKKFENPATGTILVLLIISEGGINHSARKAKVNGIKPKRMKGKRLPQGVFILSDINPKSGSFSAFQTA